MRDPLTLSMTAAQAKSLGEWVEARAYIAMVDLLPIEDGLVKVTQGTASVLIERSGMRHTESR